MKKSMKVTTLACVLIAEMVLTRPAYAVCDGCVVGAVTTSQIGITAAITAMSASLGNLLYNIGLAINQSNAKVASTVETSARSEREFGIVKQQGGLTEAARQRYLVPDSICSESASGGAVQVAAAASASKGGMRPGSGSISNSAIAQIVNSAPVLQSIDASRAAKVHAQYCDTDDYAAYGGAHACPSVASNMPGADKRVDSVLNGAGPNGKTPDLTFSQAQTDAARMYTQNSVRRSIGPQLNKGAADTAAGAEYVGIMNQYNAVISAASDPQDQRIADSQPNQATGPLLTDAMQSPSATTYYNQVASQQAKSGGLMSAREFEAFEVGRRYANTAYQSDLQAMSADNLIREQIRVAALNNWLVMGLKNEVVRGNIIQGQILASLARQEYEPILSQKYHAVGGRLGGK